MTLELIHPLPHAIIWRWFHGCLRDLQPVREREVHVLHLAFRFLCVLAELLSLVLHVHPRFPAHVVVLLVRLPLFGHAYVSRGRVGPGRAGYGRLPTVVGRESLGCPYVVPWG